MRPPLGYLIIFHTYGTWLHGGDKGSVDAEHNLPGTPYLGADPPRHRWEQSALKCDPVLLDAMRRFVVDATVREVCHHRRWTLHVHHVRTTHLHAVVSATHSAERVMNDLKGYGTRRLREARVLPQDVEPWAYHGSTRYLNTEESLARAIAYVRDEQGEPLEMKCPDGWTPQEQKGPAR